MKRPFAVIGAVCFITAVMVNSLSIFAVSVTGFAALAVFLLSVCVISPKSKHIWVIFISFSVVAVSVSSLFVMKNFASASAYGNKNVEFEGTVTQCGYYGTYEKLEIKIKNVNGNKENFYISVYSNDVTGLSEGDKIIANGEFLPLNSGENTANAKSQLADRIYFAVYNAENFSVKGENRYYKAVRAVKQAFITAVQSYLPNETGAVALGMTIGEKSGIGTYLKNCFNYSGTAHLLVVSGLHLTVWTLFISNFISVLRRKRILNTAVTVAFILLYSALTGFSVSVVRAGLMLFIIKLSRLFNRDSDSLNSLGIAVFLIIIQNPFSVYSVSFLLSTGSTLGLILFAGKIHTAFFKSKAGRIITKSFIGRIAADTLAVSISVSVFTLPVFILYFDVFPVFSFISNLFIIDLSTALMLFTVLGVIAHFINLIPLAKCLFYIAGVITKAVEFIAEKIGMLTFSTIAVPSRYFKLYLLFAVLISLCLLMFLKNRRKAKNRVLSALLITGLILTVFVNVNFEMSHPSVDVAANDGGVCILVRDGYDSVFFGTQTANANYLAGNMLKRHNLKTIGCIFAGDTGDYTFAEIKNIINDYPSNFLAFSEGADPLLKYSQHCENVKSVTLNGRISVTALSPETAAVTDGNNDIFISADISCRNLLEIGGKYDIIILSSDAFELYGDEAKAYLKNESSQIISLNGEQVTIYTDIGQIYFSESF